MPDDKPKPPSRIKQRLIDSAVAIEADDPENIVYQHSIFCQTCLHYRDPGPGVREWKRRQGNAVLLVEAGQALHPETGDYVKLGLPYGAKPRLILAHLNREALLNRSPEIEVERSLTAFVSRVLGYEPNGYRMRVFKDQLARLAAAIVRFGVVRDEHALQVTSPIVEAMGLWFPKDEGNRVLWPSVVWLSPTYFEGLAKHAIPLDERALVTLAHSLMALDVYSWLSCRLHRVPRGKPQRISWPALYGQFGQGFTRLRAFRESFLDVLDTVHSQYRAARVEADDKGLVLRYSPPPIKGRHLLMLGGKPPKDETYYPLPGD